MDNLLKLIEIKRDMLHKALDDDLDEQIIYKLSLELDELILIYMRGQNSGEAV